MADYTYTNSARSSSCQQFHPEGHQAQNAKSGRVRCKLCQPLRRSGEHGDAERYGSRPLLASAFEVDEKADRAPDQAGEPDDGRAIHYE